MRRLATETVACPGRVRQLPSVCGVGESTAELPRTPDRIAGLTETRQSPAWGSIAALLRGDRVQSADSGKRCIDVGRLGRALPG